MRIIVIFLVFIVATKSIWIGLKPKQPRCMIEYHAGAGGPNSIKINIQFPKTDDPMQGQHFYVTLRNTQNNITEAKTISMGGKYLNEVQLDRNVIYEVCINYRTDKTQELFAQYQAESVFDQAQASTKVPDNLLHKDHMAQSFRFAKHIANTIAEYRLQHQSRKDSEYSHFQTIQKTNNNLTFVSTVELIVLLAAGAYQFLTLRNYLCTKQYI